MNINSENAEHNDGTRRKSADKTKQEIENMNTSQKQILTILD